MGYILYKKIKYNLFRLNTTLIKLIVKYYVEKVENSSVSTETVESFSTFQRVLVEKSQNTAAFPPLVWITVIAEP